jgi:hypothetical protein
MHEEMSMNYMALFILDDPTLLEDVLESWSKGGIRGATIIESTGLYRLTRKLIPMRYLYTGRDASEKENVTLLAILDDEVMAEKCLQLTEAIVGDLNKPNTGIFATWPLSMVKGLSSPDLSKDE